VVVLAIAALTLIAFLLRLTGIDQTLVADEGFTYSIIERNGFTGVWHDVYHTSITPPLHYYLGWLSVHFGGDSAVLVRLPSIVFGTALVPLVFVLGRRIGGARAGLAAAAIIALGPFSIWYADEARAYATMMFLVTLSTYALLRALDGDGQRWWVLCGFSACAALWSHYTAVFVIAVQGAWALWTYRDRARELLTTYALVAVGYVPWLPGFFAQRRNQGGLDIISETGPLSVGALFRLPLQTLAGHPEAGLGVFPGDAVGLALVAVVAALVIVAVGRRPASLRLPSLRSETGLVLILAVATVAGLLVYAAAGSSLFLPRNLSASLPACALVLGLLFAWLTQALPRAAVAVVAVVLVGLLAANALKSIGDDYRRAPYRQAAEYVDAAAAAGDPVVELPLALALDTRLPPTTLDTYFTRPHAVYREGTAAASAWNQLSSGRPLWLVTLTHFLPADLLEDQEAGGTQVPAAILRRASSLGGPQSRAIVRSTRRFAGFNPVAAVKYQGLATGRLARRGGRESISWTFGRKLRVTPGAVPGQVDAISASGKPLLIGGWAVDGRRHAPVDWVLLFVDGRLLAVTAGGSKRPDVAGRFGAGALFSGFGVAPSPAPPDHAKVRAFAVAGDLASELPLTPTARRELRGG
jgi:4-amino-4-deoxy-L-arabinose transferase-like glycosyltransferase